MLTARSCEPAPRQSCAHFTQWGQALPGSWKLLSSGGTSEHINRKRGDWRLNFKQSGIWRIDCYLIGSWGFPVGSISKKSVCNVGEPGSIPESGRYPGEENVYPLQYSCLENPMSKGSQRVRQDWATNTHTRAHTHTHTHTHTDKLIWNFKSIMEIKYIKMKKGKYIFNDIKMFWTKQALLSFLLIQIKFMSKEMSICMWFNSMP